VEQGVGCRLYGGVWSMCRVECWVDCRVGRGVDLWVRCGVDSRIGCGTDCTVNDYRVECEVPVPVDCRV
jgi:hypothetical protein